MRRLTNVLFVITALIASLLIVSPSANAASQWQYYETTNGYYPKGTPIVVIIDDVFAGEKRTYEVYLRTHKGMRLYQSRANTPDEITRLRAYMRKTAEPRFPSAFCYTSATSGYMLDLAFTFAAKAHKPNKAEKRHYKKYIRGYVKHRPKCLLYSHKH